MLLVAMHRLVAHMRALQAARGDAAPLVRSLVSVKGFRQHQFTACSLTTLSSGRGARAVHASGDEATALASPPGDYQEWRRLWGSFLQQAFDLGHFAADPGITSDRLQAVPGAAKRAVLSLARQRGDILRVLLPSKLQALVRAGYPVDDRKTKNAHRRLQASILEGRDLGPADGGPAELQDVMRVFLSLAACDRRDADLFKPLIAAAVELLPDVMAAAAAPPSRPQGADQQGTRRYMPAQRDRPRQAPAPSPLDAWLEQEERRGGAGGATGGPRQRRKRGGQRREQPWDAWNESRA